MHRVASRKWIVPTGPTTAAKPVAAPSARSESVPTPQRSGLSVKEAARTTAPTPEATPHTKDANVIDWTSGFEGIGRHPFAPEIAQVLNQALVKEDVEIKPDGLLYLPEIKYRRILNYAFGPGGWGLVPRGELEVTQNMVSRDWALVCLGRFVSTARGEQEYFKPSGVPTATEGAKSNALMRCCKDLGIASELWDPRFIRSFKTKNCIEVWVAGTDGKKRKLWRRRDDAPFEYPYKESGPVSR
ncbi:hypothetical protein MVES1_002912 [Malassezia vespertilionis]|uniref:uncharacterized protein n=1 Tax=Malassezia vespertilionis TaxID=2020962 RepID=UPI0024B0B319|nr:uncharacterized protein MVES1_002912 [Malassezia vespertilionis]WFD07545.1 hypothetical protein MVES1_002912 [Malassezia vespertilionis]